MSIGNELYRYLADKNLKCNFIIEIDKVKTVAFMSLSGLEESISYKQIAENNTAISLETKTGLVFPDITMQQGHVIGEKFFKWYKETREWTKGKPDFRRDISIIQLKWLSFLPVEVDRWEIARCYPKSYKGPSYDSMSEDIAINELVIGRDKPIEKPYNLETVNDVVELVKTFM